MFLTLNVLIEQRFDLGGSKTLIIIFPFMSANKKSSSESIVLLLILLAVKELSISVFKCEINQMPYLFSNTIVE